MCHNPVDGTGRTNANVTALQAGKADVDLANVTAAWVENGTIANGAITNAMIHDVFHAFFISPVVDMERLITDMMSWAGVTEEELKTRGTIGTSFGEDLSWEYLCYVREHPTEWTVPTDILYGSRDNLTSLETMTSFARKHNAGLTVMEGGEHWFHTEEQMAFLDKWIREKTVY